MAHIKDISAWLLDQDDVFASHSLEQAHKPAGAYADKASGVLCVRVGGETPIQVIWFRAEQIEVVDWAGNPHKPVEPGETLAQLTPRRSFEVWKETVRAQARPWSAAEVDAARPSPEDAEDAMDAVRKEWGTGVSTCWAHAGPPQRGFAAAALLGAPLGARSRRLDRQRATTMTICRRSK